MFIALDLAEVEMFAILWPFSLDARGKNSMSSIFKNNFQLAAKGTDEVCMHVHIQFPFVASEA